MREILFRGKNMNADAWVYGSLVPKCIDSTVSVIILKYAVSPPSEVYSCKVWPNTVGQYTGLKDKNGKRIFEGDICRNTRTGEIVSVKWDGTMAGFVWHKRKNDNSHLYDFGELFRAYDKYEVIGNIHDNPELMGV